jgi:hypothetical protein
VSLLSTENYKAQLLLNCDRQAGSDGPKVLTVSTDWLIDLLMGRWEIKPSCMKFWGPRPFPFGCGFSSPENVPLTYSGISSSVFCSVHDNGIKFMKSLERGLPAAEASSATNVLLILYLGKFIVKQCPELSRLSGFKSWRYYLFLLLAVLFMFLCNYCVIMTEIQGLVGNLFYWALISLISEWLHPLQVFTIVS